MNTATAAAPTPSPALPLVVKLLGGLLLSVVLLVGWARLEGVSFQQPDAQTLWQRELRFADGPLGEVLVFDAKSDTQIATFRGEQGFLRSTLRALARERKRAGIGPLPPVHLLGRDDGRLTLFDPSTRQRIDLEAFGPTNFAVFASLRLAGTATHSR